jgi:hypothetical protein
LRAFIFSNTLSRRKTPVLDGSLNCVGSDNYWSIIEISEEHGKFLEDQHTKWQKTVSLNIIGKGYLSTGKQAGKLRSDIASHMACFETP